MISLQGVKMLWFKKCVLSLFCYIFYTCGILVNATTVETTESGISQLLSHLVNNSVYNKDLRPFFGSDPVEVKVNLLVLHISSISEVNMDFTVDFMLRQYWRDPRLSFKPLANITWMTMGVDFADKIWRPNTFLLNSKKLEQQASVGQSNSLIRVKHTGHVLYSTRMIGVATCSMNLKYFPADRQVCKLDFESFDYTIEDLQYTWLPGNQSVSLDEQISLPTYTIERFTPSQRVIIDPQTGNFSRLVCEIYLTRSLVFYLYQIYIPAFLIVVISWIPFWLDRDHHARVSLGVTTVLTITTLTTSTMESLPKVSYLKAIDLYLFTCFLMVFLSLIEYAIVGFFEFRLAELLQKSTVDNLEAPKQLRSAEKDRKRLKQSSRIDQFSRAGFPLVFTLFNLIYAFYILRVRSDDDS